MSRTTATGPPPAVGAPVSGRGATRSRRVPLLVLIVSVAALVVSMAAVVRQSGHASRTVPGGSGMMAGSPGTVPGGSGMMAGSPGTVPGGSGMMAGRSGMGGGGAGRGMSAGRVWLAGDGVPVASIATARARAAQAASPAGLHPGEVIWFANGFYVELKDTAGNPSTEVIVDPSGGTVSTEPGPAMMWNTGSRAATVSEAQARTAAAQWLTAHRPGEVVGTVDAYPGYYSVDTTVGATIKGMLSVNAGSGAVWYHTWHGAFIAEEDS